jgi:hypothetical protein
MPNIYKVDYYSWIMKGVRYMKKYGYIIAGLILMMAFAYILSFTNESTADQTASDRVEKPNHEVSESKSINDNREDEDETEKEGGLVGPTTEEKQLISEQHKFYNKTTGWGSISSLEWKNQQQNAELLIKELSETKISDKLETDFNHLLKLATLLAEGKKDKKLVLYLHRVFHDLDIEVNDYRTKDYYGVTAYGTGDSVKDVTKLIEKKSKQ